MIRIIVSYSFATLCVAAAVLAGYLWGKLRK